MVRREKSSAKVREPKLQKLILTPPKPVTASFQAAEHPEKAAEICLQCGLPQMVLDKHNAKVLHTHRRINAIVVSVPAAQKTKLTKELEKKGFTVEESKPVYPLLNDTVPALAVPSIWTHGFTGSSVSCAILDTGIDTEHPDSLYKSTADRLKRLGVSRQIAENILVYEAAPIAGVNLGYLLWPVIGNWGGFEREALFSTIRSYVRRRASRPRWSYFLQDCWLRWMVTRLGSERLLDLLE